MSTEREVSYTFDDAARTERWDNLVQDAGDIRDDVAKYSAEVKATADEEARKPEAYESLRQLGERSGQPAGVMADSYLYQHHRSLNGDPRGALNDVVDYWVKDPSREVAAGREKPTGDRPAYDDVSYAMAMCKAAQEYDPVLAKMKETVPHQSAVKTAAEMNKTDADGRVDAIGTGTRVLIQSGAYPTPADEARAAHEQHKGAIQSHVIEPFRQSYPDYDAREGRIGDVLESPEFREYADANGLGPSERLWSAYQLDCKGYVPPELRAERQREADAAKAGRAKAAAVSLRSAGPEGGAVSGRSGSTGSVRDDVRAAFAQAGRM